MSPVQMLTVPRKELAHSLQTALAFLGKEQPESRLHTIKVQQLDDDTLRVGATDARRIFKIDIKALPQDTTIHSIAGVLDRRQARAFLAGEADTKSPNAFVAFNDYKEEPIDEIPRSKSVSIGTENWFVGGAVEDGFYSLSVFDSLLDVDSYQRKPYLIGPHYWLSQLPKKIGQKPVGNSTENTVFFAFRFGDKENISVVYGNGDKFRDRPQRKEVRSWAHDSKRPQVEEPFYAFYVGRYFTDLLEGSANQGAETLLYVDNNTHSLQLVRGRYHAALMPVALWEHVDLDDHWRG